MFYEALVVVISYLLGSISPSYFFGKQKGVDLRKKGTGNLGASNVFLVLGKFYAVLTAFFDVLKGFLAVFLVYLIDLPELFYYVAGIFAVLGHIFPFYLNFRGGRGVATSAGVIISLLLFSLTYKKWVILFLFLYSIIMTVYRIKIAKSISLARKLYRCLAFILPIIYFFTERKYFLMVVGSVLFLFFLLDIARLANANFNQKIFKKLKFLIKKKEKRNFSTSTFLLASFFLSSLFFEKNLVILAMFLSIFGDGMAEIYGKNYAKKKFFGNKSLLGSFVCFVSCLLLGIVLQQFIDFDYLLIFIGSLATTIIELVSTRIDDNLTVPFGVSFVLWLFSCV